MPRPRPIPVFFECLKGVPNIIRTGDLLFVKFDPSAETAAVIERQLSPKELADVMTRGLFHHSGGYSGGVPLLEPLLET